MAKRHGSIETRGRGTRAGRLSYRDTRQTTAAAVAATAAAARPPAVRSVAMKQEKVEVEEDHVQDAHDFIFISRHSQLQQVTVWIGTWPKMSETVDIHHTVAVPIDDIQNLLYRVR
jgi:hypothetical protein